MVEAERSKRRGRPLKDPAIRKWNHIGCAVSDTELASVTAAAKERGLVLAEFVRGAALAAALSIASPSPSPVPPSESPAKIEGS